MKMTIKKAIVPTDNARISGAEVEVTATTADKDNSSAQGGTSAAAAEEEDALAAEYGEPAKVRLPHAKQGVSDARVCPTDHCKACCVLPHTRFRCPTDRDAERQHTHHPTTAGTGDGGPTTE